MFDQITAREFETALNDGADLTVIDTRTEDSYNDWHVPTAINIPFGPTETLDDDQQNQIDAHVDDAMIATICGKGATSTTLAAELDAAGYEDVAVVKGGMRDWNSLYHQTTIDTDTDITITQFQRRGKGCLSYLIEAPTAGEAIVVDPTRHFEQYIVTAAAHNTTITHVLDTHIHADHLSGGRALANHLDIPYHLGARAHHRDISLPFDPLEDGATVSVGDTDITTLSAPGHTSELVAYRIGDEAVLTSDALFLDGVGRTELEFGEENAERGARMAYETLNETLFDHPDDLTVLPGHVTVTSDGRFAHGSPGTPVAATFEEVKQQLDLIDLTKEQFIRRMVEDAPEKPANYETIISLNTSGELPDSSRDATQLETGANNCAA